MKQRQNLFALILCFSSCSASADTPPEYFPPAPPADLDAPWCASDASSDPDDYAPDGVLLPIGTRIFRVCLRPLTPHGERTMRIRFNPRRVEGLRYDASMATLTISDSRTSDEWIEIMLRSQVLIGTRVMGGIKYQEYEYTGFSGEDRQKSARFFYDPVINRQNPDLPPHAMYCHNPQLNPGGDTACLLYVFYEDLRAHTMFIGNVPGLRPLPYEKFPEIAQDMYRALQTADVTDEVDQLREQIPMLE